MSRCNLVCSCLAACLGLFGVGQCSEPATVELKDVPADLQKAADTAAPGAKWKEVRRYYEESLNPTTGQKSKALKFLFSCNYGKGGNWVTVSVDPSDKSTQAEMWVSLDEVPAVVRTALLDNKILQNWRRIAAKGTSLNKIQEYEFMTSTGKSWVVSADGKKVDEF